MTEGPRTLRLWRTGLACVLLFGGAWGYVWKTVPGAREHVGWASSAGWLGALAGSWTVTAALGAAAFASIVAFAWARDPLLPGLVALLVTRAQHELLSTVLGCYQDDFYPAAGALAGWVFGRAFVRAWNRFAQPSIGELDAERIGAYGAIGMLAATWGTAGISKISTAGLAWATSDAIRLMMLRHLQPGHDAWREAVVLGLVAHPGVVVLLQTTTLMIELGAVLMLASGRLRIAAAAAIVAMHAGIYVVSGIHFSDSPILAALFGFPWLSEPPSDDAPARALYPRGPLMLVSIMTALVLAMLVASPLPRRTLPTGQAGVRDAEPVER